MPKSKPPARKLRPDRRVSFIVPPDLVGWINEDLGQNWKVTELVVAGLRAIYPQAGKTLPERYVAPRNKAEGAQK